MDEISNMAPPLTNEERLMRDAHDMKIEIKNLHQRIGHNLDRIISLEDRLARPLTAGK